MKAAKKRDIARKKKLKALGPDATEEDLLALEEEEDAVPISNGKAHPDGELVDDLESDDFAFGDEDDDDLDELSSMSEWSDAPEIDTGDSMSDLGSDEDDDEEGLWSDEDDSAVSGSEDDLEGSDPAFDSEEGLGSEANEEASEADDSEEDLSRAAKKAKKRAAAEDLDALESKYEASRPLKKVKEPKALPTKLPTIVNGKVVRTNEVLEGAPVEDSDEDDEAAEEEAAQRSREPEYKSDPLGQRFGRPAVRQLLETKDKKERIRRAREEIADLGREAAGTGEGEGGVRYCLFCLAAREPELNNAFLSSSTSCGDCCRCVGPSSTRRQRHGVLARSRSLSTARSVSWRWSACLRSSSTSSRESSRPIQSDTGTDSYVHRGYRIRELSEAEREVQVSQLVARQREWENGLVATYKKFLEICEAEVKGENASSPVSRPCSR